MVERTTGRTAAARRHPVQTAAVVVGAVFLLVGVLGFIPGVTTNYDQLSFGHDSGALLLGLFRVSVLHNLVHLAFGIAGVALARTVASSRKYLIGGGGIYALLWLYGMIVPHDAPTNFVPVNWPDNWLHFVLAIGMIALGVTLGRRGENGR
jgi:hypothetical protein